MCYQDGFELRLGTSCGRLIFASAASVRDSDDGAGVGGGAGGGADDFAEAPLFDITVSHFRGCVAARLGLGDGDARRLAFLGQGRAVLGEGDLVAKEDQGESESESSSD